MMVYGKTLCTSARAIPLLGILLGLLLAPQPARATEVLQQTVYFSGGPPQYRPLQRFDPVRGRLLSVQVEVSGTASGSLAYAARTGKRFVYRGEFAVTETANIEPGGILLRFPANGRDQAPPSEDSAVMVDWYVAMYGSDRLEGTLGGFVGIGPLYLAYIAERSRLTVRAADNADTDVGVENSVLDARATVTYTYRPVAETGGHRQSAPVSSR